MPFPDVTTALDLTSRLAACGVGLAALEQLAVRRQFAAEGVFSLGAVLPFRRRAGMLRAVDRVIVGLLAAQVLGAIGLAFFGPFSPQGRLMLVVCLGAAMTVRWRRHSGGDGAEQMAMLVLGAVALAAIPTPSKERAALAVAFIAAQLSLSYVTAGIAKLVSPMWRNGSALPAILSTEGHGHRRAAEVLARNRRLAFAACWSVIAFECLFPLLLVGPDWLTVTALAAGIGFHLACALLMGLNSFLWSFPAAYPCVVAAVGGWIRN